MINHEIVKQRELLNEGLRERGYYHTVRYPADVFILESADVNVFDVPQTRSISRTHYKIWLKDDTGRYIVENNEVKTVVRKFDAKQQQVIRDWWDLLSDEVKF